MSQIVAVQELTMSSVDLLELVNQSRANHGETIVRHNDFLSRCKDELDEGDYETFVIAPPERGGRPIEAIRMTTDQCRLVGMRESKGVRRWVLNRLNELEAERKLLQTPVAIPDFMNPAEAARAWAAEFEAKQQAQQALALAAPKVEFVDKFVQASTGSKTFRQVAKLLKANEREFRAFLEDFGVMYRLGGEWMPYAQHLDAGRFEVKTGVAGNEHAYTATRFTAKGV